MAEKRNSGPPKFEFVNDNLIIVLLDKRSRILWSSETATKGHPREGQEAFRLVPEDQRGTYEEAIAQTIVFNRPSSMVLRDTPPLVSIPDSPPVNVKVTMLPTDVNDVAVCAVASILPANYDDFDEDDKNVLQMLAADCTLRQIAKNLQRSESTIDARIKSLKDKMRCKNIGGLVASAIKYRII